jgi:hypothetical protein
MDTDQEKMASGNHGDAAACGPSPGPGCSVVFPSVEDLLTTAKTCRSMARVIEEATKGRPIYRWFWFSETIKELRWIAEKAQDTAEELSQNPSHQGTTHLVRRTLDGVVLPPDSDNHSERK